MHRQLSGLPPFGWTRWPADWKPGDVAHTESDLVSRLSACHSVWPLPFSRFLLTTCLRTLQSPVASDCIAYLKSASLPYGRWHALALQLLNQNEQVAQVFEVCSGYCSLIGQSRAASLPLPCLLIASPLVYL